MSSDFTRSLSLLSCPRLDRLAAQVDALAESSTMVRNPACAQRMSIGVGSGSCTWICRREPPSSHFRLRLHARSSLSH